MPSAALSHLLRRKKLLSKGGMILAGGGLSTAFNATLTHSLQAVRGVLESFTRDSGATITDFEGLVKNTRENEARFVGARRIENVYHLGDNPLGWENPVVVANFSVENLSDVDGDFYRITAIQDNVSMISTFASTLTAVGEFASVSLKLRWVTGTPKKLLIADATFAGVNSFEITTPATEWTHYGTEGTEVVFASGSFGFKNSGVNWDLGDQLDIRCIHAEYTTGQTNQNPSEGITETVTENDQMINGSFIGDSTTTWSITFGTVSSERLNTQTPFGLLVTQANTIKKGQKYEITYTRGGTSTFVCAPGFGGVALASQSSAGTYTAIITSQSIDGWSFAVSTTDVDLWFDDFSFKPIFLVEYKNTINRNIVTDNVVTLTDSPIGADIQQLTDPEFNIDSGFGVDTDDWTMPNEGQITGGKLELAQFNSLLSLYSPEAGKYYRLEYYIDTGVWLTDPSFAGVGVPSTPEVPISIIVKTITNDGFSGISGLGGFTLEHFRITPLEHIPDDYLKGVLIEEQSTNYFLNSDVPVTQTTMVTEGAIPHTLSITGDYVVTADGSANQDATATYTWTPGANANIVIVSGTEGTVQIEPLAFATSYIPTTGATANRLEEELLYDHTFFPDTDGTAVFEMYGTTIKEASNHHTAISVASTGRGIAYFEGGNANLAAWDGTTPETMNPSDPLVIGEFYKGISRWETGGDVTLFANGIKDSIPSIFDGSWSPTGFAIGSNTNGAAHACNPIKNVKIYNKVLSDTKCLALTS